MSRFRRRRPAAAPSPKDLIREARTKLDLAASGLTTDAEKTRQLRDIENRVDALEFRVDLIYQATDGTR